MSFTVADDPQSALAPPELSQRTENIVHLFQELATARSCIEEAATGVAGRTRQVGCRRPESASSRLRNGRR